MLMINIKITYCEECFFKPRAEKLREFLKEEFGKNVNVSLEAGPGGVFDVRIKGDLIFSMHKEMRYPTQSEIKDKIQEELRNK